MQTQILGMKDATKEDDFSSKELDISIQVLEKNYAMNKNL